MHLIIITIINNSNRHTTPQVRKIDYKKKKIPFQHRLTQNGKSFIVVSLFDSFISDST